MGQRIAPTVSAQKQASAGTMENPLDGLWHLFCSPKVALLLILAIALASFAGALLMQVPDAVRANSFDYFQWLEQAETKYGAFWTKVFHWTKLFYVFNSFWFKALVFLLITNILVCSVNRWKSIWHAVNFHRVVMAPSFYTGGGDSFSLTYRGSQVSPRLAFDTLAQVLARSRYRIVAQQRDVTNFIYSDRYRLSRLGTYATHLSILLILVGVLAEGLGFRESAFIVPEGSTREVGHGTGLSVFVEDFTDEWYLNDTPKDYRSEVVLLENGAPIKEQTIRVNEPLIYKGVRFHQSFYGPAVVMEVKDRDGNILFNDAVALPWRTRAKSKEEERPLGSFTLPNRELIVYPVLTSGAKDELILPGQVLVEIYPNSSTNRPIFSEALDLKRPKALGDLEFTFLRERQFTGLQVVRTPGTPLVWVASFLLILGNVVVLFFPPRQIWGRSYLGDNGNTCLEVRALATRDQEIGAEVQRVREEIERLLSSRAAAESPPQTGGKRGRTKRASGPAVALTGGRK